MKTFNFKRWMFTLALGIGVTSVSTSAFAATNCGYPEYAQSNMVYQYQTAAAPQYVWYYYPAPVQYKYQSNVQMPTHNQTVEHKQNTATQAQPQSQDQIANKIVQLVNQERAKAGLPPLKLNDKLSKVAKDKAADMANNHYFDHTSPTYGSPFDMMKKYGIAFTYAGENIAMGQQSPEEVMNQWMNSEGHRKNILNPNYDTIGVAEVNGYWVQEFIHA